MTFKEHRYECESCGTAQKQLHWSYEPPKPCACGGTLRGESASAQKGPFVIDDQLEGGARFFEHMGPEPVYCETKTQWRRELKARGLRCVG